MLLLGLAIVLGGAGVLYGNGRRGSEPPAAKMLPNLPGYHVVEGEQLTEYIRSLSGGAALLAGQPELTAAIAAVDQIVSCYQSVGALQARLYANAEMPLSAGLVAIADRNALLAPENLFRCVAPALPDAGGAAVPTIRPCTASYTLSRDHNEFYIIYAGTTEEICRAFCAALEGCQAHR